MKIFLAPLRVQLVFYAFALTLPTSALKTFSLLTGMPLPTSFYLMGGILSVFVFWLFFVLMHSVMSWTDDRS